MVMMADRPAKMRQIPALPSWTTPDELLADALPLLDPPSRVSVTDAAERYLRVPLAGVWADFDRDTTPYMIEPADTTQSRRFQTVAFIGPSQSGKTQMLTTVAMHSVMCEPDPVQIIHMSRKDADAWVEEKLDPAILNSPDIWDRLGKGRDDSTFSRKRFKGMRLTIGYPVASQLSSRSQRKVLLTDYDHMDQVLGPKDAPEGSPYGMALQRITTFMSRGCVLLESTPAFPVSDDDWRPSIATPHEFPPVTGGIVRIYNEGTRGRWYWECPDCGDLIQPHFDRLHYDASLEPAEAGAQAEMLCDCGCTIAHRHKVELNRRALRGHGGWLHESSVLDADGKRQLVGIGDSTLRATDIASYALNGAAAAFKSWETLVSRFEIAKRQAESYQDEVELSRVFYTDRGEPYRPKKEDEEGGLSAADLRDHQRDIERGVAPSWARFITVSIDTNGSWFAVLVTAWGEQGERIMIDRFDITLAPATAPRAVDHEGRPRSVDPGRYAEDADVLIDLAEKVYPVHGAAWGLKPVALVLDFNGPSGWTDNAEKFLRKRRTKAQGDRWYLSRGVGGFDQRDRVWYEAPQRASQGKKARTIKLLNMAVDRLKDTTFAALGRFDGGVGAYHTTRWLEEERLIELLSERKGAKGYDKKPGIVRNETLDLSVQALAIAEHKGLNRINWESPPGWAVLGPTNDYAVPLSSRSAPEAEASAEPVAEVPAAPLPAKRGGIKYLRR